MIDVILMIHLIPMRNVIHGIRMRCNPNKICNPNNSNKSNNPEEKCNPNEMLNNRNMYIF